MTTDPKGVYEFGPFRLDLGRRALFRGEELLPLAPKSMDTLSLLMESAGAAVDKATLLSRVWSDTAVEENSLAKAISEIRRALGEEAHGSHHRHRARAWIPVRCGCESCSARESVEPSCRASIAQSEWQRRRRVPCRGPRRCVDHTLEPYSTGRRPADKRDPQ